jgi:hypothetical protein
VLEKAMIHKRFPTAFETGGTGRKTAVARLFRIMRKSVLRAEIPLCKLLGRTASGAARTVQTAHSMGLSNRSESGDETVCAENGGVYRMPWVVGVRRIIFQVIGRAGYRITVR